MTWLLDRLAGWGDQPAVVHRGRTATYRELLDRVHAWERRLDAGAVPPGSVVAFEGDFSPDAIALLLALLVRRCVAVPLSASVGAQRQEFCRIAEAQASVAPDAMGEWAIARTRRHLANPLLAALVAAGSPGMVLFTSGSTGTSKAALHDLTALLEKFRARRDRLCTLTFLLLDHIGGLNTLFYTLSNGGTAVAVESRDPDTVCRAIQDHRVELLPTTPSFLNLLLASGAHARYDLDGLRKITYGTEVMPESTLRRIREVLGHVVLQQTYGLTEVGILRSVSRSDGSLWVRVGGEGYETRVVDGRLWIRARTAMLGYLNAPSPFDADGWLDTRDAVAVDGDYLRILGRATDVINVGGQKVHPAEVESVILGLENVRDVVVFGEPNPLLGQVVAARITLVAAEGPAAFRTRLKRFCRERLAPFKVPARIELAALAPVGPRFKKVRQAEAP